MFAHAEKGHMRIRVESVEATLGPANVRIQGVGLVGSRSRSSRVPEGCRSAGGGFQKSGLQGSVDFRLWMVVMPGVQTIAYFGFAVRSNHSGLRARRSFLFKLDHVWTASESLTAYIHYTLLLCD